MNSARHSDIVSLMRPWLVPGTPRPPPETNMPRSALGPHPPSPLGYVSESVQPQLSTIQILVPGLPDRKFVQARMPIAFVIEVVKERVIQT